MPNACSPTEGLLPSGAATTLTPIAAAALRSIFSKPEPTRAINFKFLAFCKKGSSMENLLLSTMP